MDVAALAAEETNVQAGEEIVKKGATGATMFCILEGTVDCTNIGTGEVQMRDLVLRQGEYFGERALLRDQFRAADVRARTACFGDGDLSAPARRADEDCSAAHSCPSAVGAGAPATRGAAAELVDELVEDVGEAYSELTIARSVICFCE